MTSSGHFLVSKQGGYKLCPLLIVPSPILLAEGQELCSVPGSWECRILAVILLAGSFSEEKDQKHRQQSTWPGGSWHHKSLGWDRSRPGSESDSATSVPWDFRPTKPPHWAFSFFICKMNSIYWMISRFAPSKYNVIFKLGRDMGSDVWKAELKLMIETEIFGHRCLEM